MTSLDTPVVGDDLPVGDELVITITDRTTATVNDGQVLTSTPDQLGGDVLDYAVRVAAAEGARVPVTIINQRSGVHARVVAHPDGAVDDGTTPPHPEAPAAEPVDTTAGQDTAPPDETTALETTAPAPAEDPMQGGGDHPTQPMSPVAEPPPTVQAPPPHVTHPASPVSHPASPVSHPAAPVEVPPVVSATAPVQAQQDTPTRGVRRWAQRVARPAGSVVRTPTRRAVAAAVAVGVLAAGGGYVVGHTSAPSQTRPLDTYTGSGPGDRTSGAGTVFALAYAEFVYPRTVDGVRAVWPTAPADQIGPFLSGLDAKTTHRLAIKATDDPLVYTAALTVTAPDGAPMTVSQRYQLTRFGDGKYVVAGVAPAVPSTATGPASASDSAVPSSTSPTSAAATSATCPASTTGAVTTGNGPGDTSSGPGVIQKFDYAYYVQRDANAARALVDPAERDTITPAGGFDTSISKLPVGTTHCLRITDTGVNTAAGRAYDVVLTETQPGKNPSWTAQTLIVKGRYITSFPVNKPLPGPPS